MPSGIVLFIDASLTDSSAGYVTGIQTVGTTHDRRGRRNVNGRCNPGKATAVNDIQFLLANEILIRLVRDPRKKLVFVRASKKNATEDVSIFGDVFWKKL